MTAGAVPQVLELLEGSQVVAVVDGGWGIDALLGRQTRPHSDLDLVVAVGDVPAAQTALTDAGFVVLRDWLPTAVSYVHPDGREVDLHPITPTADGGGDQELSGRPPFHYGPPVRGRIAGAPVHCVDGDTQLRAHCGYPPTAKDHADVAALAEHLGVEPPAPYR